MFWQRVLTILRCTAREEGIGYTIPDPGGRGLAILLWGIVIGYTALVEGGLATLHRGENLLARFAYGENVKFNF